MKFIVKEVTKKFGEKVVLDAASFEFEKGKIYALLGKNGAGKTTLFNCINEDVDVDGGGFALEKDGNLSTLTIDNIGYVVSTPVVPDFLTAREFIKFFIEISGNKLKEVKTVDEYLDMVSLDVSDRDKLLKDYSHGMKNKIQMLVNFIAKPDILLLDEPLTAFDVVVAEEMKNILRKIKSEHIVIFSTHIMELALDLCDEIVILNDGVLSVVEHDELDSKEFKNKIISILKGDENV